jgi:hypothetical protein
MARPGGPAPSVEQFSGTRIAAGLAAAFPMWSPQS